MILYLYVEVLPNAKVLLIVKDPIGKQQIF